jgi:hypothetical protein
MDHRPPLFIGPSYFQSFSTWPGTRFIYGFNLRLCFNNSAGLESLLETVPLACKALGHSRLLWWEYGNEPNLYPISLPIYTAQWLNGTRAIKQQLAKACPELLTDNYGYIAPSLSNTVRLVPTFHGGLDVDQNIKLISCHK